MINILVIEDNSHKLATIRNLIGGCAGISKCDCANDINSARVFLENTFYDLLILDLNIPKRFGDDPVPQNSVDLLDELEKSRRLVKPSNIIGLTEFEDLKSKYQHDFEKHLWTIIHYDAKTLEWEVILKDKILYLLSSKSTMLTSASREYQYDIAFITALRTPEFEFVLNLPLKWNTLKIPNDSAEYHVAIYELNGHKFNFVAGYAPQMGMAASAVMTMKMIHNFRPKYVVMTGIAAGIDPTSTSPGDVLVAQLSFDYGNGKSTIDDDGKPRFEPDYKTVELNRDVTDELQACIAKCQFLDEIYNEWKFGNKPAERVRVHLGPFASGSSVVVDPDKLSEIKEHQRKLIGIDMEAYGVYYAANNCSKPKPKACIAMKSISDFGNKAKSDNYQSYASYTSAQFAFRFFTERILPNEIVD